MPSIERLIRKSVVARDYRGCTTRHLSTLIVQGNWPPPDVKATKLGEADYYYESTALKAREEWLRRRGIQLAATEPSEARQELNRADSRSITSVLTQPQRGKKSKRTTRSTRRRAS